MTKFLSSFYLAKDFNLTLWSYDKCEEEKGKTLETYEDGFWYPEKGQYALVMDIGAKKYSTTITQMIQAYSDFEAGWYARGKKN